MIAQPSSFTFYLRKLQEQVLQKYNGKYYESYGNIPVLKLRPACNITPDRLSKSSTNCKLYTLLELCLANKAELSL